MTNEYLALKNAIRDEKIVIQSLESEIERKIVQNDMDNLLEKFHELLERRNNFPQLQEHIGMEIQNHLCECLEKTFVTIYNGGDSFKLGLMHAALQLGVNLQSIEEYVLENNIDDEVDFDKMFGSHMSGRISWSVMYSENGLSSIDCCLSVIENALKQGLFTKDELEVLGDIRDAHEEVKNKNRGNYGRVDGLYISQEDFDSYLKMAEIESQEILEKI